MWTRERFVSRVRKGFVIYEKVSDLGGYYNGGVRHTYYRLRACADGAFKEARLPAGRVQMGGGRYEVRAVDGCYIALRRVR